MNSNSAKDNYTFIFGFLAIIFSLGSFKDELKGITIDIGFIQFTLLNYFFVVLCIFILSLYFMALDNIISITPLIKYKALSNCILIAYFLFILCIISPLILGLILILYKIRMFLTTLNIDISNINALMAIISSAIGIISTFISLVISIGYSKNKKQAQKREIDDLQAKLLETASKSLELGFYFPSVIEASRALESHITKLVMNQGIRADKMNLIDQINFLEKGGVMDKVEIDTLQNLRKIRNQAVHTSKEITKEEATRYLHDVRDIIEKVAINE